MSKRIKTSYERFHTYDGWHPVEIEEFRTKRQGDAVRRYRFTSHDWGSSFNSSTLDKARARLKQLAAIQPALWRKSPEA